MSWGGMAGGPITHAVARRGQHASCEAAGGAAGDDELGPQGTETHEKDWTASAASTVHLLVQYLDGVGRTGCIIRWPLDASPTYRAGSTVAALAFWLMVTCCPVQ